jgi:hypothetical protein
MSSRSAAIFATGWQESRAACRGSRCVERAAAALLAYYFIEPLHDFAIVDPTMR